MHKRQIAFVTLAVLSALVLNVTSFISPKQVNALGNINTALKWSKQVSAGTAEWRTITWSSQQSKFVALGARSVFPQALNAIDMTSADGKTWALSSVVNGGSRPVFTSVTWSAELGLFVGVSCNNSVAGICALSGNTSSVITSSDGVNWTVRTNPDATALWRSVTWGADAGVFVAVANNGGKVMTSADGINWTSRTASSVNAWRSVTWSPQLDLFVAVAASGTDRVMTSPDGITWTSRTAAVDNSWVSVTWSPELGKFVAVSEDGINRVMTSSDGINWTTQPAGNSNAWTSVAWSPQLNLFTAVASSGTDRIMTSPDGITWTPMTAIADTSWNAITWSSELEAFMAVSGTGIASERVMSGSMATVGINPATNITAGSATINGEYLDKFAGANVFFRYRVAGSGNAFTETAPQAVTAEGGFSANISSLAPGAGYEYKAVVQWPTATGTQTLESGLGTFITIASVVENPSDPSGGLADTGQNAWVLGLVALALLGIGGGIGYKLISRMKKS